MVIDPISDMLTRIRNAVTKKHKNVLVPSSKFKVEIAKILQNEGFINSFQIIYTFMEINFYLWWIFWLR